MGGQGEWGAGYGRRTLHIGMEVTPTAHGGSHTSDAPSAEGASLSQEIVSDGFVYTWGLTPMDPEIREVVGENMAEQTERVLENLSTILKAARPSLDNVIKTTVFVTDLNDYDVFNEVYTEDMNEPYPARSVVNIAGLSTGVRAEIEMVAEL